MNFRTPRPSAPLIVSLLALVIAMTGSAVAVVAAQSGDSLIATRTLSGNRLRLNTVTDKEVANLQWHKFELRNDWENYNDNQRPPAWAIDVQGVIHLRGAIHNGTTTTFGRLPVAARPSVYVWVSTNLCDAIPGRIVIDPTGFVQADYSDVFSDAACFTSLDGVTWAK